MKSEKTERRSLARVPMRARTRKNTPVPRTLVLAVLCAFTSAAHAGGVQTLEPVTIAGSREGLVGLADSASEGTVTQKQIATRPWLRPGEVLETVPGLIVTQHSGDGKANQFFLRGFNLDHGTDFATFALGVPVNLPTHAHGQGYTDVNFLIPELINTVRYRKGPYSAQQGDFSAAGSVRVDYVRTLESSIGEVGFGENGFRRLFAATAPKLGAGNLLIAGEGYNNDGPWLVPQDYRKKNAVLRYAQGSEFDGFDVSFLAYDADWTATDQVARRAVDAGLVSRFGSLDPSTGGETSRYSLSTQWARRGEDSATRANAYIIRYKLNLFSNFTYFASDPANGDQFEQADRRTYYGGEARHTWKLSGFGRELDLSVGGKLRFDDIDNVGLFLTRARQRLQTIRADGVEQTGAGAYVELGVPWSDLFRTVAGVRADTYRAKVTSDTPANSGTSSDEIVTPKFTAVFGPIAKSEFYASIGHGFHSNDARGTTATVNPDPRDPGFGTALDKAPPLVRAKGRELGARTAIVPGLQTALALWELKLASELVFVGDAGTTEASRPSRRRGVEFANYWTPLLGLTVDLDLAWSSARFRDFDPAGDRIPGAIERTASFGVAFDSRGAVFGGLRARYFGPRPLIEDNSVRSASSTLVNARLGYRFGKRAEVALDVLNLLDRKVDDIEYFYESQLAGEAAPVADRHFHPAEPRTVRVTARLNF
jgi:outer membrane receptor protein involved in Fe transport